MHDTQFVIVRKIQLPKSNVRLPRKEPARAIWSFQRSASSSISPTTAEKSSPLSALSMYGSGIEGYRSPQIRSRITCQRHNENHVLSTTHTHTLRCLWKRDRHSTHNVRKSRKSQSFEPNRLMSIRPQPVSQSVDYREVDSGFGSRVESTSSYRFEEDIRHFTRDMML